METACGKAAGPEVRPREIWIILKGGSRGVCDEGIRGKQRKAGSVCINLRSASPCMAVIG